QQVPEVPKCEFDGPPGIWVLVACAAFLTRVARARLLTKNAHVDMDSPSSVVHSKVKV
ncbi:hypothetical protein PoMZ_02890, partial [Pyricularia oryzae]